MIVPIICERYADNGELSHYDVINKGTGTLLWEPGENGEVNSVSELIAERDDWKKAAIANAELLNEETEKCDRLQERHDFYYEQAEVARHEKDFLTAVAEAEELRGRLEVALGLFKSEKSRADNLKKERDLLEISRNFYYNQWKENETITPWFEKDFQLPESGRLLIVRVLGDDIPEMAYVEKSISEDCFVSCLTGERLKVTHWMYIPEFKEDESCK